MENSGQKGSPVSEPSAKPKRRGWFLYSLGVIVTILGICGSNADYLPFVRRVISPLFASARIGFDTLLRNGELKKGEEGFAELAYIAAKNITFTSNGQNVAGPPIQKFRLGDARPRVGRMNDVPFADVKRPVLMEFPYGEPLEADVEDFRKDLDELKLASKSQYGIGVSVLGIAIGFIGFMRKTR